MKFAGAILLHLALASECDVGSCSSEEADLSSALQGRRSKSRSATIAIQDAEEAVERAAAQKEKSTSGKKGKARPRGPFATTSLGLVLGKKQLETGQCEEFKGIPFAKAPVEALRFAEPVEWDEPFPASGRKAREWGPACPQWKVNYETMQPERAEDEDCLFLNIQRPIDTQAGAGLPLLVFIYGGGFSQGTASDYDFCGLSGAQGLTVATMNYRLGPFGFAAADGIGSNLGIKDQRLALQWLKREANAFGSSPDKITIMGESAGAASVFHHMGSPLSEGLFRAAIAMSGYEATVSLEAAKKRTVDLAMAVSCDTSDPSAMISCLRSKSVRDLLDNAGLTELLVDEVFSPGWNPTVDNEDMPTFVRKRFESQQVHRVPLLIGANTDEGTSSVYTEKYMNGLNESEYATFVDNFLQFASYDGSALSEADQTTLRDVYMADPDVTPADRLATAAEMVGDAVFLCPTMLAAQDHSQSATVFLYRFNQRFAYDTNPVPGVYHGSEVLPLLFPIVAGEEAWLASTMQKMWADFAKTLDPAANTPEVTWPQYDATETERKGLVIQLEPREDRNYKGTICNHWQ